MIEFTKLHGNGNDFILIDEMDNTQILDDKKPEFAVKYCNRRFGIGADGVLFISKSKKADIKMRLFQEDASEPEMCGNGIRCLVKYAFDKGYIDLNSNNISVETLAGILMVSLQKKEEELWIKVNMEKPFNYNKYNLHGFEVYSLNTGVPHTVIFVEDFKFNIMDIAPKIRYDSTFEQYNGTNVNFAKVISKEKIEIRTYERGVEAETLSCGTGSVAAAFVAHMLGKVNSKSIIKTKGGILNISIENDIAFMEGTATTVFRGAIDDNEIL